MSLRKLTTFIAAGIATFGVTAAVAEGADYPARPASTDQSIYFEADGGWIGRNWTSFAGNTVLSYTAASNVKNGRGGWTMGGALGYQLNRQLAFELGYWGLRDAKGTSQSSSVDLNIKSWFAYSAVKGLLPLTSGISAFGKIGAAYTWNLAENMTKSASSQTLVVTSGSQVVSHYFNVLFGAGLQFNLGSPNWVANAQYLYIPGYYHNPSDNYTAPAINVYSVGMAYKLAI